MSALKREIRLEEQIIGSGPDLYMTDTVYNYTKKENKWKGQ